MTKKYCDRCGKDLTYQTIVYTYFNFYEPNSDEPTEVRKELCKECAENWLREIADMRGKE